MSTAPILLIYIASPMVSYMRISITHLGLPKSIKTIGLDSLQYVVKIMALGKLGVKF